MNLFSLNNTLQPQQHPHQVDEWGIHVFKLK